MRIELAYARMDNGVDAISAYCERVAKELNAVPDTTARVTEVPRRAQHWKPAGGTDVVVLQYNPFAYARWGCAPTLPSNIGRGCAAAGAGLAVMFHETFVAPTSPSFAVMALWQRAQVDALARRADVLLASCRAWADQVRRRSARAVHHVPVGSTIDVAGGDARLSEEGRDDFIVAAFGTGHPSRSMVHLAAALNALARHGHRPVLLNLGSGAPRPPDLAADVRIISPGALPGADISRMLSRAQLGLTPFVDGVSSRRTTVAAMMAHGIPLLGTSGVNTDEPFVNGTGCLELVPVDDIDGYAAAAVRLAADPRRRVAVGAAGLALYERSLAWPVIARRLREVLEYRR